MIKIYFFLKFVLTYAIGIVEILSKESDPAYVEKLASLLKSTREWDGLEGFGLERAIENFMKTLGSLYLEYFLLHVEEAKICAIDFQDHLPRLVKPINRLYIDPMSLSLESADEWDDPWEGACWVRTNIEAFQIMLGEAAGRLDDLDIVEYMDRMHGSVRLLRDEIPKNAPKEQWWWYADFKLD